MYNLLVVLNYKIFFSKQEMNSKIRFMNKNIYTWARWAFRPIATAPLTGLQGVVSAESGSPFISVGPFQLFYLRYKLHEHPRVE